MDPELSRHHRRAAISTRKAYERYQALVVRHKIVVFSIFVLVQQTRLLAQSRSENNDGLISNHIQKPTHKAIHFLIAPQDRGAELPLFIALGSHRKKFRLHMPPVRMLHVRGAIQKERRK